MKKILVLHGPNLNLLGTREPAIYGATTLAEIDANLKKRAHAAKAELMTQQTNCEAELIAAVHAAVPDKINYIIINAAAFSHTSIALRDALAATAIPFVEVHLSNVYAREEFRHHSYLSAIALGVISGFGPQSYYLALHAVLELH